MAFEESILRTRCKIDTDNLSFTQSTSQAIILVAFNAFVYAISADLSAVPLMTHRGALHSGSTNLNTAKGFLNQHLSVNLKSCRRDQSSGILCLNYYVRIANTPDPDSVLLEQELMF